jgi:hypothetical protein
MVTQKTSTAVTLPSNANTVPLGEAFWENLLGFTPAHSVDSFALVNEGGEVSPIAGPTPSYPTNAPCWVAKGPRSVWYTANSPGKAISIFFTDGQSGIFYKSLPLPGNPTDITVTPDKNVSYRQNWGEDRVWFQDTKDGRLHSLPMNWTDAGALDPIAASLNQGCIATYRGGAVKRNPSTAGS